MGITQYIVTVVKFCCIVLFPCRVYHNTYILIKRQPFLPEQTTNFSFSENYVFGKFDTFCDRLSKIISMFDLVDDYNSLFERRMEGH